MTVWRPSSNSTIDIFHFIDLKKVPGWVSSVAKAFPSTKDNGLPLLPITCLEFNLSAAALDCVQVLQHCGGLDGVSSEWISRAWRGDLLGPIPSAFAFDAQ
jgi:hypothetical protein